MITISVPYSTILASVRRATEYEGSKNGAYEAIRAIPQDTAQIRHWYNEGVSIVAVVLDRLMAKKVGENSTTDDYEMYLNVNNGNTALVAETVAHVVESHVLSKWLRLMNPDKSAFYKNDEAEQLESLKRMCYYRKMPM